jgi:hypothetical protein
MNRYLSPAIMTLALALMPAVSSAAPISSVRPGIEMAMTMAIWPFHKHYRKAHPVGKHPKPQRPPKHRKA